MNTSILTGKESLTQLKEFILLKSYSSVFILTDVNTDKYCYQILKHSLSGINLKQIIIPAGEQNKNYLSCEIIFNFLLDHHADRNSLLINLGGGVVTDAGGFCASVFKRGLSFINVPTTLMAMADAATGGKTGINFSDAKNIIGTFIRPAANVIHTSFLNSLDNRNYLSGWAEIIKHLLLSDEEAFIALIENNQKLEANDEIIEHSIRFKLSVTEKDFLDSGERKQLNFGHTLGHAFESLSVKNEKNYLLHGEAVVAGMAGELYLSNLITGFPAEKLSLITTFLLSHFARLNISNDIKSLIEYMTADKKNSKDQIAFSLLHDIGKPAGIFYCTTTQISEAINFVYSVFNK